MFGTVKTALWKKSGVMEAAAEGTRLARLSLVAIRTGRVAIGVKAERGKKLFRRRSERSLNLRELANSCGRPCVNGSGCRECGNDEKGC